MFQNDPNFFKTVITGDNAWVHNFDPVTKSATSVWKHADSPSPKKYPAKKSAGKVIKILLSLIIKM